MEQRLSVVTLGVADLDRSRRFYEDGLGWRRGNDHEEVVFFQTGAMILALYSRDRLAEDAKVADDGHGFDGVALAYCTRTRDEVDAVLDEAVAAGAKVLKPAQDAFWGGYSGYFADPDGHAWEVAWNPDWTIADDGSVSFASRADDERRRRARRSTVRVRRCLAGRQTVPAERCRMCAPGARASGALAQHTRRDAETSRHVRDGRRLDLCAADLTPFRWHVGSACATLILYEAGPVSNSV